MEKEQVPSWRGRAAEQYFYPMARPTVYSVLNVMFRVIPQETVDNNLGPERLAGQKGIRSQLLQTTIPLITRPLSGSPNCAWK